MFLRELYEANGKTAVVAFGRMNPPTIGHAKLVDKIKSIQGDHYVFLSQTQKPKTDPLAFADKLRYAKFFFPEITIGHPEVRTPIQMLQKLEALGYTDIIYVAGSDRIDSFTKLFNDYNGKEYNFNSIEVVSAGERDPDAEGAEGMSASKMRAAAADGDAEMFSQGVPRTEVADEMFDAVRKGMGIKELEPAESIEEGNVVIDKSRLRSHIISLIADKIAATDDVDQLADWLKYIVGKELRPRKGSDYRYVITDEDIVEAFNERKLTGGEKRSREANVKKLKTHKGDFEKRYGDDAESVMYAVATKRAKGK